MTDQMNRDGYTFVGRWPVAFPVLAWTIDLEVQFRSNLSAPERTILRLAGEGLGTTRALAEAMGLGADQRLVATTATRLLEVGALEIVGAILCVTPLGQGMLASSRITRRENVTTTVYYRPLERRWSWKRPERPSNEVDLTIELPEAPAPPRERPDEVRDLLRSHGVPELELIVTNETSPDIDLLALQELKSSTAWESVELDLWRTPGSGKPVFHGRRDGELDERLTRRLVGAQFLRKRRRIVLAREEG